MGQNDHAREPLDALKNSRLAIIISVAAGLGALAAMVLPNRPTQTEVQKVAEEARRLAAEQAEVARVARALAAVQLQAALLESAPYEAELNLLQRLDSGKDHAADLAILSASAQRGVPQSTDLLAAFDAAALETLAGESSSWAPAWIAGAIDTVKAATVSLGMRASLTPPGAPAGPVIRTMRAALVAGDVKAAVAAADALPDAARPAFETWRKTALNRIDAIAAANRIVQRSAINTTRKP